MSPDSVHTFKEDLVYCDTYSDASEASCKFADPDPKHKIDPSKLELYKGDVEGDPDHPHPGYQRVVGVCLRTAAGTCVDVVRLDIEKPFREVKGGKKFKGIHFNAKPPGKGVNKLAAILRATAKVDAQGWPTMSEQKREDLYREYLKALENRSAQFIWKWWSTGKALSDLE